MSLLRALFFVTVIGCMIVGMYMFYPHTGLDQSSILQVDNQQTHEVLSLDPVEFSFQGELQQGNLVQFFRNINLVSRLKHIKLEGHSLFIDLISYEHDWDEEAVFNDTYEMIAHIFTYTNNINKLYIRFFNAEAEQSVLLCYIFAERDNFMHEDLIGERDSVKAKAVILDRTELTYGIGWRK